MFHIAKRSLNSTIRWLDLHLLLVWLLSVPAILPLIQPSLTHSADGLLHLYRTIALDQAINQGVLFPRWLPDLVYGYGLPLFVYYAPLSYYLTEGLNLLGLGAVSALNTSLALAILASGTGTYLFVKSLFGSKAGLLAGVAYVYAPYQLFNVMMRGSLPIAWATAIFPFAFWTFDRLIKDGRPFYWPLSALATGVALLAHNITSLIFLPLLAFYLTVALLLEPDRRALTRVAVALLLGLGLASFFLGPAIIERDFIQVERVITPPDFDYHFNFVSPRDLISLSPPANTGLLNPDVPFTLGLAQVGIALVGLVGVLGHYLSARVSRRNLVRSTDPFFQVTLFATFGLMVAIFMMLPFSVQVWDSLPLITFVQQPHRLLSLTAFLLAVLAGMTVAVIPKPWEFWLTLIGIGFVFVTAVPLLYPRYYSPLPYPPTLAGMMNYEHDSGAIGTTSFGEYVPIWVKQIPPGSPLEPMYQTGAAIKRFDPAYLSSEAAIAAEIYGFNEADLLLESPEPFQALFNTFYFPGWQVLVDGQEGAIAPISDRGLIGVSVPTGRHRLQLRFRETPVRLAANGLSGLSLIIVILAALRIRIFAVQDSALQVRRFSSGQLAALTGLAVTLIAVKLLYLDHVDNPLKQVFNGTGVAQAEVSMRVNFDNQVSLLGYDLRRRTVLPGQNFELTAYWQAQQPLTINYSALAQLVDDRHNLYAGQDNLHPGGLPTSRWEPWGFAQDHHEIQVPYGTPPGDYFLVIGLYEPTSWARLPVLEGGHSEWVDVVAVPVQVLKSTNPPSVAELDITWPVEENFGRAVRLLGATPERDTIRRNDFLRIAIFWEAKITPAANYRVNLALLTDDGTVSLDQINHPSHGRYPTTDWVAGERVRDNHAFWIPIDFPLGKHQLQVRLVDEAGQVLGRQVELGTVNIEE